LQNHDGRFNFSFATSWKWPTHGGEITGLPATSSNQKQDDGGAGSFAKSQDLSRDGGRVPLQFRRLNKT